MMKPLRLAALLTACLGTLPAMGQSPMPAPLTCLLGPIRSSDIGSDRSGIVASVPVKRADFVEAGAVLVQIDDALAQTELQIAVITRDALQARLERSDSLRRGNMISRDEIAQMETELNLARAEAERARLQVARARIVAPFAGYVARIEISQGELIGAEPVIRLIDMRVLRAELVFLAQDFGRLRLGDLIALDVSLTGATVTGKVTAIDPFIDAANDTFTVLAEIENPDLSIPAGAACRLAGS